MPRSIFLFAVILSLLAVTGCEPFENAEQLFPLPAKIWDRAVPVKNIRAFEIKEVSYQEFINIKALLIADRYQMANRDFHFSSKNDGNTLTVKASDGILLTGKKIRDKELYPAAIYIERKNILLLGIGIPEK